MKGFFEVVGKSLGWLLLVSIEFAVPIFLIRSCATNCSSHKEKSWVEIGNVIVPKDDTYYHRLSCWKFNHNADKKAMNVVRAEEAGFKRCKECFPDTCHYIRIYPDDYEHEWHDYRSDLEKGRDYVEEAIEELEDLMYNEELEEYYNDLGNIKATLEQSLEHLESVEEKDSDD